MIRSLSICALALTLAACSLAEKAETPAPAPAAPAPVVQPAAGAKIAAADLPPAVTAAVKAAVPGMTIAEAERKEREGRVYYDVEGARPDGSEVELDLLQEGETFRVVEIQRDIDWASAPAAVRTAAKTAQPVRVIESTQTDGTVIYELFAAGKPAKPSLEVRLKGGKADVLTEEWPH